MWESLSFYSLWFAAFSMVAGCRTIPASATAPCPVSTVSGEITDDEAARLALRNNAAFRELMIDMGIAEADVMLASQLPNPNLLILFPLGPKQLEYTLKFPAESLWLRPCRTAVAKQNSCMIGKRLVQDGLDLVRDVKVACADLRFAQTQRELAREKAGMMNRFERLAKIRLEAGDISDLESSTAELDSIQAKVDLSRTPVAEKLAYEKLRNLLGLSNNVAEFSLAAARELRPLSCSDEKLVETALATRPDLHGAEIAMGLESKRVGLAEKELLQITTIFDANGSGSNFEAGPGIDVVLPVFHQNQGQKALADAKFKKACQHYIAIRDQIALEVRQSAARYRQAESDLEVMREELLPVINDSIEKTESAWNDGNLSYLFVLEATRKANAAHVTESEILAEWYRAAAELERAVGAPVATENEL